MTITWLWHIIDSRLMLHTGPTWAEMCRQREEVAEKMRKQLNE
jgi:hypothetical protein